MINLAQVELAEIRQLRMRLSVGARQWADSLMSARFSRVVDARDLTADQRRQWLNDLRRMVNSQNQAAIVNPQFQLPFQEAL